MATYMNDRSRAAIGWHGVAQVGACSVKAAGQEGQVCTHVVPPVRGAVALFGRAGMTGSVMGWGQGRGWVG